MIIATLVTIMSAFVSGLHNFVSGLFAARVLCSAMCDTDSGQ